MAKRVSKTAKLEEVNRGQAVTIRHLKAALEDRDKCIEQRDLKIAGIIAQRDSAYAVVRQLQTALKIKQAILEDATATINRSARIVDRWVPNYDQELRNLQSKALESVAEMVQCARKDDLK